MATTLEQDFALQSVLMQHDVELQQIKPIRGVQCYRIVNTDPSGRTEQDDRFAWGIAELVAPERWEVLKNGWHSFLTLQAAIEFIMG
jgi:hypothetical protein